MDQQALTMKHTLAFEAFEVELVEVDADEESLLFEPDVEIFDTSVWKKNRKCGSSLVFLNKNSHIIYTIITFYEQKKTARLLHS